MARKDQILKLLDDEPNDAFLLFALAKEYEKENDLKMANKTFIQLKSLHPNYVGLYYHLGKLYELLNDREKALETYSNGIEISRIQKDHHAMSELMGAKANLEIDD